MVSVILPCYNAGATIGDAIRSIVNQSFRDWELVIVDDASTDDTVKRICDFKDARIKVVELRVNGGYPVAMNEGIRVSQGKFIARMDADDICLPSRLEEQLNALSVQSEAAFCGTNRFRITPGGKMYCDRLLPARKYTIETWDSLMTNERLFTDPSVVITKDKILAVGGYRTFQRSGMDVDLWFRVMEKFGPCVTISEPLFGKRLEPGSLIFNPHTALINQVPRALARQRKLEGKDNIEKGEEIDLAIMLRKGLIRLTSYQERVALFIGSAVTCLMLLDGKGFWIYYKHAWNASHSFVERLKLNFELLIKLMRRLRNNPYRQFNFS